MVRDVALMAVLAASAAALGGCFGGHDGSSDTLHATTTHTRLDGAVKVEELAYSSSGRRVPALFVTPRGVSPRGCLIWESGRNARKEDSRQIWDGAARLGLAVFSIDFRDVKRPVDDPSRLADQVRGSVTDLRRGVDYLERRRECRKNIGFGGLGLAGAIGSVLAGGDPRIRATVIMSTPPTWKAAIAATDLILPGVEKRPDQLRSAERILSPLDPMRWITRVPPRPVLVLIGRKDPLVPPRAAAQLQSAAGPSVRIVKHRGGYSPFKGPDAAQNALRIQSFLLKWLVKPAYSS